MPYLADPRARGPATIAALVVQALLAWVLVSGLAGRVAARIGERFEVLSFPALPPAPPPPPPQPTPAPRAAAASPAQAAGKAGAKAEATQIVAPKPRLVLIPPPPVTTATAAGRGDDRTSGAAASGAGSGAGGEGAGPGGGGLGGPGGGGAGGGSGAQRTAGALRDSDYPRAAARVRAAGTVGIRFMVGTDGRVRGCEVTASSGNAILDETTCRLVEKRFRYRPAFDRSGRPVESVQVTDFTWGPREP